MPQIGPMITTLPVCDNSISATKIFYLIRNKSCFNILYSNVDGLINKKDELMSIIEKDQPKIIALSEIKPKRQYDFNIAEYNIPGYNIYGYCLLKIK